MPVDNRRIAKNTMMLYIRMLLLLAVSLYTSRVVLAALGVDDYGIYNLIGGVVTLFSFISHALVGAMQRYFNVSMGHGDKEEYQRIYSMGINIFAIFSVFLIVVGETVGLWLVKTQLNIPAGRETAALWVYQISIITLIVNLFRTPDNASIIAHEKMEFYAYISIFEAVIKLAIVFVLNMLATDKLILYVLLYLGATIIINIAYLVYCRVRILECRYSLMWDNSLFKSLVSFSGWNMLSGGARVLKSQGDSIFLNHYYSVAVNASFGVAAQVYNAVNLFLTNFQTAFKPQLVQSFAAGEMKEHYRLISRSARMSYFLLLLIVVPVIFNLDGLLGLWLKEVPQYTREFCMFVLLAYLVDSLGAPLGVSVNAEGHIREMQIVTTVILFGGLVAGFLFLRSGAVPYIITIITFFVHVGFWLCYMYYARKYSKVSLRSYFKEVVVPVMSVSVAAVIVPVALHHFVYVSGWYVLLLCLADIVWVSAVSFLLGLAKEERAYILTAIQGFLKKHLNIIYGKSNNFTPPPSAVLLIGFNRPDTMQQVFDAVRLAKPDKLYFAVDGPRREKNEEDKVQAVRDIIRQVDWPCDVHTLFREENVGCGFGPAGAIAWAFENEDRLIVLEDDCVPSQSFFRFCNEMLERYMDDERISIVSGRSHWHGSNFFDKYDYLFTRYAHTWGWATWKRVWTHFDIYMKDVPEFLSEGGALNIHPDRRVAERANASLRNKYEHIAEEVTHSWDSQWAYTRLKYGLGIVPSHNLIHNVGDVGTHSNSTVNKDMPAEEMPEVLRHPRFVMVNRDYENYHYKHHIRKHPSLLSRAIGKLKREWAKRRSK